MLYFYFKDKMASFTIVVATMKHDSTQESVLDELNKKVSKLDESGWICVGDIIYHTNAVSQIMIPIATMGGDVAAMRSQWDAHAALGTTKPKTLVYAMGGSGHMGVHTQYANGVYYDF